MRSKKESNLVPKGSGKQKNGRGQTDQFICRYCHRLVLAGGQFSGVRSRNHCPYCLHSRHLDMHTAGDRLSACKALMEPVGLTCKRTAGKYGQARGELMLIHRCLGCGKLCINRIAGDDDERRLVEYFESSWRLPAWLRERLAARDIELLGERDAGFVYSRVFGQPQVTRPFRLPADQTKEIH
jgi:hypothetical protein